MQEINKVSFKGLIIWLIALVFYFYECFLRVFPNTISQNILHDFHFNAEQFALISSSFFLSYAIMQAPVGILIQKYGVRFLLAVSSGVCALGVFWFSFSDTLSNAVIARFLMGLGSSFGYIALLAILLNWFPSRHFGFMTGLTQLLGSIGPIMAGAPLVYILHKNNEDWRSIFIYIAIFGVFLTLLLFLFIRNKPKQSSHLVFLNATTATEKEGFALLKKSQIIWIALYNGIIYLAMPTLGSFWGTLYLQSRGLNKGNSAFICSMIWVGYSFGAPIIGRLSDHTHRRIPWMILSSILGIVGSLLLLFFPTEKTSLLISFFILIGLGATGQVLAVAIAAENVFPRLRTSIMGFNNTFLMLLGAIVPSFIGVIIHPSHVEGVIKYSQSDFVKGLSLLPIFYIITLLIAIFGIKETFCRSQYKMHFLDKNKGEKDTEN